MKRTNCAVCLYDKFNIEVSMLNFPVQSLAPKNSDPKNDIFIDYNIVSCLKCGCLQLSNLVDLNVLYREQHYESNWVGQKKQFEIFSNMIIQEINDKPVKIIEVGAGSGKFAKILKNKQSNIDYTILDICPDNPNIEDISFINANCENYDFPSDSMVVASHMFEHLYTPHKFVKNLSKNNVRDVFIIIPNQRAQIKHKIHPVIYHEHTYLVEKDDIAYIFGEHNYYIHNFEEYDIHALILHFKLSNTTIINVLKPKFNRYNIKEVFEEKRDKVKNLILDKSFYIIPASHSGMLIYYNVKNEYKTNLLGFLDNDRTKAGLGKRFYGTDKLIFRMEHLLKENDNKPLCILIHKGAYINEIMEQVNAFGKNIQWVII